MTNQVLKFHRPTSGEIKDLKVKVGDKVSEGIVLAIIENGQACAQKSKYNLEKQKQKKKQRIKRQTNGNLSPIKKVKESFCRTCFEG